MRWHVVPPHIAVPFAWDDMTIDKKQKKFVVDVNHEQFKDASGYDFDNSGYFASHTLHDVCFDPFYQ